MKVGVKTFFVKVWIQTDIALPEGIYKLMLFQQILYKLEQNKNLD